MGAFEESTWWEGQYPSCGGAPGQGVAAGLPATGTVRTRDVSFDACPSTPKRITQGKPFDLLAADALIVSPMKVNSYQGDGLSPTAADTLGSLFSEQDGIMSEEGKTELETSLNPGGEGSDILSGQTTLRVCSNASDDSFTIADAEQSIGMEDALWAADVPNLPDIVDLGRAAAMEEADLSLPTLGMGALGVAGDDGIGFGAFSADPLGEEASEEGENSAGHGEEEEVGPAALLAAQGEELVWMNSSGGWKQVPASHFRGDLLSQTTATVAATMKASPAKRARSCGALDAVCGSDSEGAGKVTMGGTPRSTGKVRRVSETGKMRSPRGAKPVGPTSPRGAGKTKRGTGAGSSKRPDEWDVEGPLPPRPLQGDGPQACTNCATTNTPLWRGGPHGPKTLCNACGVRYMKSAKKPRDRPRV